MLTRDAIIERLQRKPPAPLPDDRHLSPVLPGARITLAAVLVPLVERPHGWSVILTRRSDAMRNHSGQVALPGSALRN